ncbi:MAG: VanZ family protein [Microbacteriaceae bacterium]|jgi:VanZ family protein|nr:VanZ family protein [Microbacteriaceae bacterium]HEV7955749.1 VanZ family protein [Marisediminicola sp.]
MFRRHPILSLATFAYLAFVGWVTLGPQPIDDRGDAFLWRLLRFFGRHDLTDWITYQRLEFFANVWMFVPVGMFFLLLFGRRYWWVSVTAGAALTGLIEFVQLFLPDRVSDVSDIIANTIGTIIGVLFALVVTAAKARRLREDRLAPSAALRRAPH